MISNIVELTHMGKLNRYVAVFPWRWNAIIDTRYIELFPKDYEEFELDKLISNIKNCEKEIYEEIYFPNCAFTSSAKFLSSPVYIALTLL